MRFALLISTLILTLLGCGKSQNQIAIEPEPTPTIYPNHLPVEITSAWEKAGAKVLWLKVYDDCSLLEAASDEAGCIPAFELKGWDEEVISKLPIPTSPFALCLDIENPIKGSFKPLARLTQLVHLTLDISDPNLPLPSLADLQNVTYVKISNIHQPEARLKEISALKNLRYLAIDTKLKEQAAKEFKTLSTLKKLEHLFIAQESITDDLLQVLNELNLIHTLQIATGTKSQNQPKSAEEVVSFDLSRSPITESGIKSLKRCKNLKKIILNGERFVGRGLNELGSFEHLEEIDIRGFDFSGEGLKELSGCKILIRLALHLPSMSNEAWKEFIALDNYTELDLSSITLTEDRIKQIFDKNKLDSISLKSDFLTDDHIKNLARFPHLKKIGLQSQRITDHAIEEILHLDKLTSVTIKSEKVTDAGLSKLLRFKDLTELHLFCPKLTDKGIKDVATLTKLTKLTLISDEITDSSLAEIVKLKNLDRLVIQSEKLSRGKLAELPKHFPNCTIYSNFLVQRK